MTLVVDYEEFAKTIKKFGSGRHSVFYRRIGEAVHVTYVDPDRSVHVVSFFHGDEEALLADLKKKGISATPGIWITEASLEHLAQAAGDTCVVGIAYETRKGPGLWMDVFPTRPSEGQALRAMFDEFVADGILQPGQFEQFVHNSRPIVCILDAGGMETFLKRRKFPTVTRVSDKEAD